MTEAGGGGGGGNTSKACMTKVNINDHMPIIETCVPKNNLTAAAGSGKLTGTCADNGEDCNQQFHKGETNHIQYG